MAENNFPRRKKNRSVLSASLSFIAICAALVFGLSVFFKVSAIEVEGNDLYTAQEVIDASGIEEGDNLVFVNCIAADSRIYSKLSYIENVSVTRKLPNKVIIKIVESKGEAAIAYGGEMWILGTDCKLLQKADASQTADMITVTGINPTAPTLGETLVGDASDTGKVTYLAEMLTAMSRFDMCDDITKIDMSNVASPEFDYLGRFTVKMGSYENVEYKIELLLSAVNMLEDGDTGTIDLSLSADNKAHFSPD